MASPAYLLLLAFGTITTGCLNSLFTKYQDNQCVRNCNNPDVSTHKNFEQPVLQTLQMFIGEFSIYMVYWVLYKSKYALKQSNNGYTEIGNPSSRDITFVQSFKLALPAICDICATTLVNIGLLYTPVSIYQMTRGSVVLFVAIFSVIFLHRKITKLEWISLVLVSLGVVIVGLSGISNDSASTDESTDGTSTILIGMVFIVVAMLCQAAQFVVEEQILSKQSILPLRLVYFEGFYGASILLIAFSFMHVVIGTFFSSSPKEFKDSPFNIVESFSQMFSNRIVLISSICIMVSISSFNFFGISLTHELSATSRSTVDTCRTLLVWILAIAMGWESFAFLQFLGFVVMVFGTLCFNGVLNPEKWNWVPASLKEGVHVPILDQLEEDPIERS
ncbi:hypothetical protein CLIB1423_11S00650 [[Candida] railenensis]|uniref:Sugar phosphate transporter domain-containing protein n=1 Tax=[Candida] railenensis TaxID=45579 RepID=A0A9P0QRL5_9ASCO|nr:hypothetical protein CLIB1423_11S00650 [[Candida] railenensis]